MKLSSGGGPTQEKQKLETAILWCRRDLRVTDNPALNAALQLAKKVVRMFAQYLAGSIPLKVEFLSTLCPLFGHYMSSNCLDN